MANIVVLNDVGRKYAALAASLQPVAEQVAPLVREVTGLALPDNVVIRTITARKWLRAHNRRGRKRLYGETMESNPQNTSMRKAVLANKSNRVDRRTAWTGILGQVVDFRGSPKIAILPQALDEAGKGADRPTLCMALAHEMTHMVQYNTDQGAYWNQMNTLFPQERGIADRDYAFLAEGHAYWADHEVTTQIFGAPVQAEPGEQATRRYREMAEAPAQAEWKKYFARARERVAAVVEAHGVELFNRVWSTPDLVPLKSETGSIDAWPRRFAAAAK